MQHKVLKLRACLQNVSQLKDIKWTLGISFDSEIQYHMPQLNEFTKVIGASRCHGSSPRDRGFPNQRPSAARAS